MEQLSKIPSEAIEQAIRDLEEVENDTRYKVTMVEWHAPRGGTCHVCMAGAVMAKRYGIPITTYATPGYVPVQPFDTGTQMRLVGLDMFRAGRIDEGLKSFGVDKRIIADMAHDTAYRKITPYDDSPWEFKRQMMKLASDLRQEGM